MQKAGDKVVILDFEHFCGFQEFKSPKRGYFKNVRFLLFDESYLYINLFEKDNKECAKVKYVS